MWPNSRLKAYLAEHNYRYSALLFFVTAALVLYGPYLNRLPWGFHDWAQSDRLSLALGFYDYNFDFFHPRTLALNTVDSVTGVEPPIQAYLAGLLGLLVGRSNITVAFRCLDLAMMVVGFYFLFRLVFESTGSFLAGLVPAAFLLASPIFIYYSGTYTPDPFSASLVFVAAYYYWRFYYRERRFQHLQLATAIAGLAMLVKILSGVYFLAFTGVVLIASYLIPTLLSLRQKLLFFGLVGMVMLLQLAYILYHQHLNVAYGSGLFLATALPIKTMAEHEAIWSKMRTTWSSEYFTPVDYYYLKVSLGLVLVYALVRWRTAATYLPLVLLGGLCASGVVVLYALMGSQLMVHDYYIIAPLMPLLVFILVGALWALQAILSQRRSKWIAKLVFVLAIGVPLVAGAKHHYARMTDPYKPHSDSYVYRWMVGGEQKLRAAGVPPSAFILVLGESAPNLSLVYFNRRGITWNPNLDKVSPDTLLRTMAGRRLSYLIMRKEIEEQVQRENPALLVPFRLVFQDDKCYIFKPLRQPIVW